MDELTNGEQPREAGTHGDGEQDGGLVPEPIVAVKRRLQALLQTARERVGSAEERTNQQLKQIAESRKHRKSERQEESDVASQIARVSKLTGITFSSVEHLNVDATHTQHKMRGHTSGVAFRLEFTVNHAPASPTIASLRIALPPVEAAELRSVVAWCEGKRAVREFLRALVSFARLRVRRRKVFGKLRAALKGSVVVPHGARSHVMTLQCPNSTSVNVVWTCKLGANGSLEESVQWLPWTSAPLPAPVASLLSPEFLQSTFQSIAKVKGVSCAVEVLARGLVEPTIVP